MLFLSLWSLLFAASAAATVAWCLSMSAMGGTPMPGGWTLSMAWMPMCGQTWSGAAAAFLGMWGVMMGAMMLPALLPLLRRHRRAVPLAAGYFAAWGMLGAAVFAIGALAAQALLALPGIARAVPLAGGVAVLLAGALQCSAWKARHLACCRAAACGEDTSQAGWRAAWRQGLRLGGHCILSCAGLTAVLLVLGVMDLRAMGAVMAAVTLERLAPAGAHAARATGALAAGAGLVLIARAAAV